jgi:hypothetical protein
MPNKIYTLKILGILFFKEKQEIFFKRKKERKKERQQ